MLHALYKKALSSLKNENWEEFVNLYLNPHREIIEFYYNNFAVVKDRSWENCLKDYKAFWFDENSNRDSFLSRLEEINLDSLFSEALEKIERIFPNAKNIDVFVILGLDVSNAFQVFMLFGIVEQKIL